MIWVVPFIWIIILKAILQPSIYELRTKKKRNDSLKTAEDTGWTNGFYNIFHSESNSQSHSSHDTDGHSFHGHDSYGDGGHH